MKKENLIKLLKILDKSEKKNIFFLVWLLLCSSVLESLGILSIIPVIKSILSTNNFFINYLENLFHVSNQIASYLVFSSVILIYILKFFVSTYITYIQKKIVSNLNAQITKKLFNEYLIKPFTFHVNNNSSILIKNLQIEVSHLFLFLESFFLLTTEAIVLIALIGTLIYLSPVGLIIFSVFSAFGVFVYKIVFFKRGVKWGDERKNLDTLISKTQLESFNGIKEIKLNKLELFITNFHDRLVFKKAVLNAKHLTSLQISRYLFEMVIIMVIIFYLIALNQIGYSTEEIISMIGVFGLAAIKIIPSISKVLNSFQSMNYYGPSLNLINKEFENLSSDANVILQKDSKTNSETLKFDEKIELRIKSFGYRKDKRLFKDFNFVLYKKEFLGIAGESGKGKSTLLNIFVGLLQGPGVELFFDDNKIKSISKFYNSIGYLSQSAFVFDESIQYNITLDDKKIDKKFLEKYKKSKLLNWISESGLNLNSNLGENGSKLSGGQKQRLGLARALYKDPKILILDEPTASLDELSEQDILEILKELKNKITIILVSHKRQNFKFCDRIINI